MQHRSSLLQRRAHGHHAGSSLFTKRHSINMAHLSLLRSPRKRCTCSRPQGMQQRAAAAPACGSFTPYFCTTARRCFDAMLQTRGQQQTACAQAALRATWAPRCPSTAPQQFRSAASSWSAVSFSPSSRAGKQIADKKEVQELFLPVYGCLYGAHWHKSAAHTSNVVNCGVGLHLHIATRRGALFAVVSTTSRSVEALAYQAVRAHIRAAQSLIVRYESALLCCSALLLNNWQLKRPSRWV